MVKARQYIANSKPSIATPPTLDLRAIQSAIDNIRERIVGVETLANGIKQAGNNVNTVLALQQQVGQIQAVVNQLSTVVAAVPADDLTIEADMVARAMLSVQRASIDALELAPGFDPGARNLIAALALRVEALEQEPL